MEKTGLVALAELIIEKLAIGFPVIEEADVVALAELIIEPLVVGLPAMEEAGVVALAELEANPELAAVVEGANGVVIVVVVTGLTWYILRRLGPPQYCHYCQLMISQMYTLQADLSARSEVYLCRIGRAEHIALRSTRGISSHQR